MWRIFSTEGQHPRVTTGGRNVGSRNHANNVNNGMRQMNWAKHALFWVPGATLRACAFALFFEPSISRLASDLLVFWFWASDYAPYKSAWDQRVARLFGNSPLEDCTAAATVLILLWRLYSYSAASLYSADGVFFSRETFMPDSCCCRYQWGPSYFYTTVIIIRKNRKFLDCPFKSPLK